MEPNYDSLDTKPKYLFRPVTTSVAALTLGLATALVLTTTLNGFIELKQTINQLVMQQNYASVSAATKDKISAYKPVENIEPQETNRVIVKFKEGKLPSGLSIAAEKANLEKAQGLNHVLTINGINAEVYEVGEDDTAAEVVQRIIAKHKDNIEYAEVDMQFAPAAYVPNDPYYPNSWHWHIRKIMADVAWDTTQGEGVTVAILDSGIYCAHPDLAANCVSGWNTYNNNSDTSDQNGHGTAVSAPVAEVADNAQGGVGIAFKSKLMPVRVSDANGVTSCSALASGITYAVDHGAKVASNSYKIIGCSSVNSAADYMAAKGGLYVRAIGNDGYEVSESNPDNIIHVSATDENDNRTSWSNFGTPVDLAAPGINVFCTFNNGSYGYCRGTSFSVPIVSGTLALMFSVNPSLSVDQAKAILFSTTDDLGTAGWDMYYGHGRVNAAKAVAAAKAMQGTQDTEAPTTPTNLTISGVTDVAATLAWSPSTDNVLVTGYNIYRNGQKLTTTSNTNFYDNNLSSDTTYTYTVSAVDGAGNESAKSSPASVTTQSVAFNISSYSVTTKTNADATIGVNLTKSGTVTVKYGTTSGNLNLSTNNSTLNNTHSVNLTGLSSATTYYYQVVATDQNGTTVTSPISSFKTTKGGGGGGGGNTGGGKGKPVR